MPPSSTTAKRFAWPPVMIGWAAPYASTTLPTTIPTSSASPISPSATVKPSAIDSGTPSTKSPAAIDSPRAASAWSTDIVIGWPAAAAWPERRISAIPSSRVSHASAPT